VSGGVGVSLQPSSHFEQNIDYNGVRFARAADGRHVYTVHIVNTQTTYQFDRHFRVRLLEQFDSSQRRLLTDLLGLYEVVPGTVFHAGYGSLYEKRRAQDPAAPGSLNDRYRTVTRGLFFKASYAKRL